MGLLSIDKTLLFDFHTENVTFLMLYKKLVKTNIIFLITTIIYIIIIEFLIIYPFFVFLAYYSTFYDLINKTYMRHLFNVIMYLVFLCVFFYINFILFLFFFRKFKKRLKPQIDDFLKSLQIPIIQSFSPTRKFITWNIYIISNLLVLLALICIFNYDFPFFLYHINDILNFYKNEGLINMEISYPYFIPDFFYKKRYWWLSNYFLEKLFVFSKERVEIFKNIKSILLNICLSNNPINKKEIERFAHPYLSSLSFQNSTTLLTSYHQENKILPIPFQTVKTVMQYKKILTIILYEIEKYMENNQEITINNKDLLDNIKKYIKDNKENKKNNDINKKDLLDNIKKYIKDNKENEEKNNSILLKSIEESKNEIESLFIDFADLLIDDEKCKKFQRLNIKKEIPNKDIIDTFYLISICLFIILCFIERSINNRQDSIIIIFSDIIIIYFIKENNCLTVLLFILNNIPLFLNNHNITFNNNFILFSKKRNIKFNVEDIILKDIRIYFLNKNNISKDILNIKLLNINKPSHLLCGPSGAGKTMLLSLLLQLFSTYKNKGPICTGQYMIKSHEEYINMNEVNPSDFKKSIIYLPQFPQFPNGDFSYLLKSKNYIEILEICEIQNIFIKIGLNTKFHDIKEILNKEDIIKINLSQALIKLENEINNLLIADETFDVISKQNFIKIKERIKYYFIVTHIHQNEGENIITINNNTALLTKDVNMYDSKEKKNNE